MVRIAKQNSISMKDILHHEMFYIDFVHVTTIILVSNDKAISKIQKAVTTQVFVNSKKSIGYWVPLFCPILPTVGTLTYQLTAIFSSEL